MRLFSRRNLVAEKICIHRQTVRDFYNNPRDNQNWDGERLRDPDLLTRPRTVRKIAQNYETQEAGPGPSSFGQSRTESIYQAPPVSESVLKTEVEEYTDSQKWLFDKFRDEIHQYPTGIYGFETMNLLHKIVFWLSKVSPQRCSYLSLFGPG